jgi:hypothetical protein
MPAGSATSVDERRDKRKTTATVCAIGAPNFSAPTVCWITTLVTFYGGRRRFSNNK